MLRHHEDSESDGELRPRLTGAHETDARDEDLQNAQIEDFLDRVFARLVAIVPYEERQARRDAMRDQVLRYVAAHRELGADRNEAVALALAQVQREQAVAAQAVRPVQTVVSRQISARTATAIALGFFGLFYLLDQTCVAGHIWNHLVSKLYAADGTILRSSSAVANFYRFELFVLPIISGLGTGLLSRARPVRGTLNALAILSVPAIAWAGIAFGLQYTNLLTQDNSWVRFIFPNPIPAVCGVGFWALLGCLSAGAGGWLRRRMPKAKVSVRSLIRSGRRIVSRRRAALRPKPIVDSQAASI